jgi:hypothetical protein
MKYFSIILIILILCFTSCDGKHRVNQTYQEKIENSNLSKSFFEKIEYFPKVYTEVITDTILSNGFRIRSKFYSDMEKNVLREFKKDSIQFKNYYREFNVELTISKNGVEIFSKLIDKDFFVQHDFSKYSILNDVILLDFELIDTNSSNSLTFNFDYYPEAKDALYRYKLVVFEDGNFKVFNESVIF